ncbi:MAG: DUF1800 domain-containing protein [SAR202 cluster bacterium]|nr:DUF1800 domain-containing protein [SAR202 cluster bacterium]|tara:strand:- start:4445 stop:5845 length:1401 start_codon:yes stop_codon:yes gene_type:complete
MAKTDPALIAHLYRRAGFGATYHEIQKLSEFEYDEIVENLLEPQQVEQLNLDIARRYHLELNDTDSVIPQKGEWIYRMVNSQRHLEEKMTLFWHYVFATGAGKSMHYPASTTQIETFRDLCLTDMKTLLMALSKDPAMNFWLDNCENHKGEPNENWGRELLELFSMGVGMDNSFNYSEEDVKMAARAFTGWSFTQPLSVYPYGAYPSEFVYLEEDHDDSIKTFLGNEGNFNGEDILDMIIPREATARFICRHMYTFFVADEPQVPAWNIVPPQDPEAIKILTDKYMETNGDIKEIMRTLLTSEFFKDAKFKKIKSPVELMVGTMKASRTLEFPEPTFVGLALTATAMGQNLMYPPTVEGWHTGREWIDAGTLNERINFAVGQFDSGQAPGLDDMINEVEGRGNLSSDGFVDACLELLGYVELGDDTRETIYEDATSQGDYFSGTETKNRLITTLQQIVSSVDYQFG